jgi:hypothetical protein
MSQPDVYLEARLQDTYFDTPGKALEEPEPT